MVATSNKISCSRVPAWHQGFSVLVTADLPLCSLRLPGPRSGVEARGIAVRHYRCAGRLRRPGERRGKADVAYAAPLAGYAIKQYRDGRRFAARLNVRDVSSTYAQKSKNIHLERLDRFDRTADCWEKILVEDRRAGPFDIVRTRLDFGDWLRRLPAKRRRIAKFLASGESTTAAAEKFGLVPDGSRKSAVNCASRGGHSSAIATRWPPPWPRSSSDCPFRVLWCTRLGTCQSPRPRQFHCRYASAKRATRPGDHCLLASRPRGGGFSAKHARLSTIRQGRFACAMEAVFPRGRT